LKKPSKIAIDLGTGASTTALVYAATGRATATLILGHGAGANQQSAFMVDFADALSNLGLDTVTFNFLYTEQRRKVPDRAPALEACYVAVVESVLKQLERGRRLFIGGKSMGGRIATQIAAANATLPIAGLVLLGYPLHPPGQPQKLRDAHLSAVRRPMLFVQGSRDVFGTPRELEPVLSNLSPAPTVFVVEGGDHSFKLGTKNPSRQAATYTEVQECVVHWITAGVK
jgi:predicted alpha/beta-hydrolase family hydrolase